jgi:hypothetical protein
LVDAGYFDKVYPDENRGSVPQPGRKILVSTRLMIRRMNELIDLLLTGKRKICRNKYLIKNINNG